MRAAEFLRYLLAHLFPSETSLELASVILLTGVAPLRAKLLCDGKWWQDALRTSASSLADSSLWSHLPPTEATSSAVFRAFARTQAGIHDYLCSRCRTWPLRLSQLLMGPGVSAMDLDIAICEFLSAPQCFLDTFSRQLRARYGTPAFLTSDPFQTELRFILIQIVGTTYNIERLHSRSNRSQKSRRMTHVVAAEDMAIPHATSAVPHTVSALKATMDRQACEVSKPSKRSKPAKKKSKRRHGGGGACRAFLHCRAQELWHRSGRFDIKEAMQQYKSLRAEDREKYVLMGQVGTRRHRCGEGSFGPTIKLVRQRSSLEQPAISSLDTEQLDRDSGCKGICKQPKGRETNFYVDSLFTFLLFLSSMNPPYRTWPQHDRSYIFCATFSSLRKLNLVSCWNVLCCAPCLHNRESKSPSVYMSMHR